MGQKQQMVTQIALCIKSWVGRSSIVICSGATWCKVKQGFFVFKKFQTNRNELTITKLQYSFSEWLNCIYKVPKQSLASKCRLSKEIVLLFEELLACYDVDQYSQWSYD